MGNNPKRRAFPYAERSIGRNQGRKQNNQAEPSQSNQAQGKAEEMSEPSEPSEPSKGKGEPPQDLSESQKAYIRVMVILEKLEEEITNHIRNSKRPIELWEQRDLELFAYHFNSADFFIQRLFREEKYLLKKAKPKTKRLKGNGEPKPKAENENKDDKKKKPQ